MRKTAVCVTAQEEGCFHKGGNMSNLISLGRRRPRVARFVPRLEALEDRNCPSSIAVEGHTLLIRGDANANTISITDSGNGTITGTIDGQTATGTAINHVVVHSGAGDDTLTYTLTSPLTTPEHLQIDMGTITHTPNVKQRR
jgi:hypothetical protein